MSKSKKRRKKVKKYFVLGFIYCKSYCLCTDGTAYSEKSEILQFYARPC